MKFDEPTIEAKPIYTANDCIGYELCEGDIVIGAIGTDAGYIFKGKILEIMKDLIKVETVWYTNRIMQKTFRVSPKRVRGMKYEKDNI